MATNKNYFSKEELSCKHCGEYHFDEGTLQKLNNLREEVGAAMAVTSGYRCKEYNSERGYTQTHASGQAVDISCTHKHAFNIMKLAAKRGFTGIGIKQKGSGRFIHLDDLTETNGRPRPHIWSY